MARLLDDALDALELPILVRVTENLYVAAFQLMKLLPARRIIQAGMASGAIGRKTRIVETTSGTFGLGLALVCRKYGLPLTIVGDPAIDASLRRRLEVLGAEVVIVECSKVHGGIQQARLDVVKDILAAQEDAFWPAQYDNPQNPESYESLVPYLSSACVDGIDTLVGTVGSGGSMCGLTRGLRRVRPGLTAVAVDTHGSVLFGHADRPRRLRGLGNSIKPANVDHSLFDQVHWVSARDAFRASADLYRATRLFMGGTSGASFLVGQWRARNASERVLCILPDEGTRYLADFCTWSVETSPLPEEPVQVAFGEIRDDVWSYLDWRRAPLQEFVRHE